MADDDRSTWSNEPDVPASEGALPEGDQERYQLGALIGQGGVGEVRAATDLRLDREVAIKLLIDPSPGGRSRFLSEAHVTARLEHPNIIPVHDLGLTEDGRPYLAMKRVRGRSLRDLLVEGRVGPTEARLEIFRKICDAVAFAHAAGILHRDLKPENVMVGEFGEVLLMDWGAAVPFDPATGEELAPTGGVVGTPNFMAPEQSQGLPGTPRLDIYGLGAVLYELLTDQPAFPSGDDLIDRVRRGELRPPRLAQPALSAELERVILRAMAVRPEDRYPSVVALREDIDAVLARRPLVHVGSTSSERLAKWMDRHQGPLRTAAAAAGIGLSLMLLASWRHGQELGVARDEAVGAADRARTAEREAVEEAVAAQVALADALEAQGLALEAERRLQNAESLIRGRDLDRVGLDLAWSQHVADSPPPVARCAPHGGAAVRALALSPDGREVWSWGDDGRLVRWDPVGCVERSAQRLGEVAGPGALDAGRGVGALLVDGALVRVALGSDEALRVPAPEKVLDVGLDGGVPWVRDAEFGIWQLDEGASTLRRLSAPAVEASSWRPEAGGRAWVTDSTRTGHELGAVWRAGEPAARFSTEGVSGAELSGDGRTFLYGDPTGVGVFQVEGGGGWRVEREPVSAVGLSPDDTVGWAQSFDGSIHVFDLATGAPLADYVGPGDQPTAVAATPRARLMAIAGAEGRVLIYLLPAFPAREPPQPMVGLFQGLAVSPDGQRLAVGSEEGELALVDAATGRTLRSWSGWKTGVRQLAFSPDGRRIAAAVRYDGVVVLDPESGAVRSIPLSVRTVSLAWTAEGLTTVDVEGKILRVDPDSGAVTPLGQGLRAGSWALSARDGKLLTAGHVGDEYGLLVLSAADGSVLKRLSLSAICFHTAWSPDGTRAAVACSGGKTFLFDLGAGVVVGEIDSDAGPTIGVDWSPDGALLATTGYGRQVKLWDAETGALLRAVSQHEGPGVNVRFSPDGARLYSSGSDGYRVLPLRAHQEHQADVARALAGGSDRVAALARLGWWERVEEFAGDAAEDRRLVQEARLALEATKR